MSHNQRSAESSIKKEIEQLKKGNQLTKNNKLYQLDVFIDADGVVKVGGRLRHSSLSDSLKTQIRSIFFSPTKSLLPSLPSVFSPHHPMIYLWLILHFPSLSSPSRPAKPPNPCLQSVITFHVLIFSHLHLLLFTVG